MLRVVVHCGEQLVENSDEHVLRFIEHVQNTCEEHGVNLWLANKKHFYVRRYKKYFPALFVSPPEGFLMVAMKHPEWLRHLAHEFSHLEQWREGAPVWNEYVEILKKRSTNRSRRKVTLTLEEILIHHHNHRAVEIDCEQRTIAQIQKWNLPLDVAKCIQIANAHIWSITLMVDHEDSLIGEVEKKAATDSEILARCPTEFLDNYDDVPEFFREAYMRALTHKPA